MPQDMFRAVVARPASVRSRRSSVALLSLAAHGAIVLGLVFATLAAPDTLPFPRTALAYFSPVQVRLVDIDLPAPPPVKTLPKRSGDEIAIVPQPVATSPLPAAPVEAPTGVSPETGDAQSSPANSGASRDSATPIVVQRVEIEPQPLVPVTPALPVRLHSGITAPRKVVDVAPIYPSLARTVHVEGIVVLEATIDTEGVVTDLRVLRSVPLLDDAALQAVRQWRYTPGQLNGQAVAVIITVTVRFALDR